MTGLITTLEGMLTWLQPAVWILVAVALTGCGLCMAIGGQKMAESAKSWLPRIAIGAILVIGATTLAQEFVNNVQF